jgi:hypothetical protein
MMIVSTRMNTSYALDGDQSPRDSAEAKEHDADTSAKLADYDSKAAAAEESAAQMMPPGFEHDVLIHDAAVHEKLAAYEAREAAAGYDDASKLRLQTGSVEDRAQAAADAKLSRFYDEESASALQSARRDEGQGLTEHRFARLIG